MHIGQRIKELRKSRNLLQKELADAIGAKTATISQWETGFRQPSNAWRQKIARYFGISEGSLLAKVTITKPDPLRLILEHLGYTPDDLAQLSSQDWETVRNILDPVIKSLLSRKDQTGAKLSPRSHSVFIVDDEVKVCHLLAEALKDRGFICDYAFNGKAAIDRLLKQNERPDVIILDMRMPLMNGIEFLQQLRATNTESKVIIITAFAEDIVELYASNHDIEGYFEKPIDLQAVVKKIEELV